MVKTFWKQYKYYIILLVIFLFSAINIVIYNAIDTAPPPWDDSWHLAISYDYYKTLTLQTSTVMDSGLITERASKYPHLLHLSASPLWVFNSIDIVKAISLLYLAILLLYTYLLGKEVGNHKVGLLAAFIVSMYPMVFGLSRRFLVDFPVIAFTVPVMYYGILFLKKNQDLKYLGLSYGFFVAGILTKQSFLFIVGIPLLIVTIQGLYQKLSKKQFFYSTLGLSLLGLTVILIYMYTFSGFYLLEIILRQMKTSSISVFGEVLGYLLTNILTPLLFALFVYALFFLKDLKHKTLFFVWMFFPLIAFAILNFLSAGRYFAGIAPAFAIVTAYGLRKAHAVFIVIIILFCSFQFMDISYNDSLEVISIGSFDIYRNKMYVFEEPKHENWKFDEIFATMEQGACVSVGASYSSLNIYNLGLYSYINRPDVAVVSNCGKPDYFIVPTGNYPLSNGKTKYASAGVTYFKKYQNQSVLVEKIDLPSSLSANIYKYSHTS